MLKASPPGKHGAVSGYIARRTVWWRAIPGNVRGGIWMMIAAAFFSMMVALIKAAGETLHVTEILFFRQVFMMVLVFPVIASRFPQVFKTKRPGLQAIRILSAATAMLLGFTAVLHLPLADAITIGFAKTFFITIFAILFLSEVVGIRRWAAMAIGFIGVLVVAGPAGGESINLYGLMAIGSAAAAGLVMIIIRILTRTDKPVTILTYQAIGIGLLMIPPTIWFWKMPNTEEWILLIAIGVFSLLGQMSNIYAFRAGEASAIAPLDYLRLFFGTFIGLAMFNEWPEPKVFIGAAVIIGAALYTMQRELKVARELQGGGKLKN